MREKLTADCILPVCGRLCYGGAVPGLPFGEAVFTALALLIVGVVMISPLENKIEDQSIYVLLID